MTSLMSMSKGRFKSKRNKSKFNNMARKRKSSMRGRSSRSSSSSGVFSGKILGFHIPVIGGALRNKTVQKAIAGAGIVSLALTVASLVNNPTVNKIVGNKMVRLGLAGAAGDVTGIATEFVREGGIKSITSKIGGGSSANMAQSALTPMPGGGIA